ncbi:hypothetical protein TorRG33x02_133090 [Trema orientale]|uniref:Uncharacterized protein n=1 Tax=Trema orientale TaxID=63057 RepID=A0A2P5EZE6_TREOI|nr:hypothetical protein TorRG33x02_133090 [Trema orientale]
MADYRFQHEQSILSILTTIPLPNYYQDFSISMHPSYYQDFLVSTKFKLETVGNFFSCFSHKTKAEQYTPPKKKKKKKKKIFISCVPHKHIQAIVSNAIVV